MAIHQFQVFNDYKIFIQSKINTKTKESIVNELYALYYKRLLFFIRSMVQEDSEDLLQEIFIKVFEKIHTYNPLFSFSTWIYTITRNHCINHIQKKESVNRKITTTFIEETHGRNSDNPKKSLMRKEISQKIDQFLKRLEPNYRHIAFLRYYEHMKIKNITRIVNIPEGTVKSRLNHIKNALKVELEEFHEF